MYWGDRNLARYLQRVVAEFEADNDVTRALRRLHIKGVHLQRRGDLQGVRIVRKARRLI